MKVKKTAEHRKVERNIYMKYIKINQEKADQYNKEEDEGGMEGRAHLYEERVKKLIKLVLDSGEEDFWEGIETEINDTMASVEKKE